MREGDYLLKPQRRFLSKHFISRRSLTHSERRVLWTQKTTNNKFNEIKQRQKIQKEAFWLPRYLISRSTLIFENPFIWDLQCKGQVVDFDETFEQVWAIFGEPKIPLEQRNYLPLFLNYAKKLYMLVTTTGRFRWLLHLLFWLLLILKTKAPTAHLRSAV